MEPLLKEFADDTLTFQTRRAALERYAELPSGRERPGRYWRVDLDAIGIEDLPSPHGSVEIRCADERVLLGGMPPGFGSTSAPRSKFGALAVAFANRYAFVTIPAGVEVREPIFVTYRVREGSTLFPYTCVFAGRDSRATVIERFEGAAKSFVCGITEAVTEEGSDLRVCSLQGLPEDARAFFTRAALPGRDASLTWSTSDLGGSLCVCEIDVALRHPGARTEIASIFFPSATQHVDVRSTTGHFVGETTSITTVKSAAVSRGQARYVGNIHIAENARRSDASLKDDALLLSPTAHIDSVPALEISNNDVKAYHGATVGALDEETLFYMTTRGIDRAQAERMVTIGFFEPALQWFPGALHEELRETLTAKIGAAG